MCSIQIIFFALFYVSNVLCKHIPVPCDLHDNKCLTVAAERKYLEIISGMPGVETSDPLHVDLLEANLPTFKYKIIDASLSGLKSCHMDLLQFYPEVKKFYAHYSCPHLIFESKYEVKGKLGPELVEGKGPCRIDYYDYSIHFNGDYRKIDTKTHIQLENTTIESEVKGKAQYEFKNLFNGSRGKSEAVHKFANENYQFVDKLIRQPAMEAFMKKHIENVNAFLRIDAIQDILTY